MNGVTGGLLGSELGEGGGHVSFADVISIGWIRAVPGLQVTVPQLAHHCPIRARTGLDHNYQVDPGCNDQAELLPSFLFSKITIGVTLRQLSTRSIVCLKHLLISFDQKTIPHQNGNDKKKPSLSFHD